jgi:hypothetical protein
METCSIWTASPANQSGLYVCHVCVAIIRAVAELLVVRERSLDSRIVKLADNFAENLQALSAMFPNFQRRKSKTGSIFDCVIGMVAAQCPSFKLKFKCACPLLTQNENVLCWSSRACG